MDWRLSTKKISCVTVTTGRLDLLKKSIFCYCNQTYPDKELIIVSQGSKNVNNEIQLFISSLGRLDIFFIEAPQSLCLGEIRNLSIELTNGDIICQWDDDDLYHPERLSTQFGLMELKKGVASCYNQFLKYYTFNENLYWCDWSGEDDYRQFLPGTIMFYKNLFYRFHFFYPEEGDQSCVEEDLNVLKKIKNCGTIIPIVCGYQYVYVYHGENTYNLDHHNLTLDISGRKKVYEKNYLLSHKELILEMPIGNFNSCDLEGEK